jgi:two-component system chemotaxis response regulator CheY
MGKRVLIVDDSPIVHVLLRKTLEANGHEVCGDAKNGREGVDLYSKLKPDAVFMDITMPQMDGIQAVGAIKASDPGAKIIMLTAMGDEEIVGQAKAAGVDIFLQKPFDDYKIISALSKLV